MARIHGPLLPGLRMNDSAAPEPIVPSVVPRKHHGIVCAHAWGLLKQ